MRLTPAGEIQVIDKGFNCMPVLPPSIAGTASLINQRTGFDPDEKLLRHTMYARVLKVNWHARTVDCVGMHRNHGNGKFVNVPMMTPIFTQTEALHWLPDIAPPTKKAPEANAKLEGNDDALAILLFVGNNQNNPVCLGFISPGYNEFSFAEEGTKIERHTSDVYNRLTKDGTYEFAFPDGTYLKVAPAANGYQLTNLSELSHRDKTTKPWTIKKDGPRIAILNHASGTNISISETGDITIHSATNININATDGSIVINGVDLVHHVHTYKDNNNNTDYTSQPGNP